METLLTVALAVLTLLLLVLSAVFLHRFATFPSLPTQTVKLVEEPSVSIVVPVRDEVETVESCITSLIELDYADKEILVVDGGSTDGTRDVLERYSEDIEILDEGKLLEGWVGKNWACHLGSQRCRGELLLFSDGDTVHSRDSLRSSVNYVLNNRVEMLSLYPGLVMKGFWEKLMLPTIAHSIFLFTGGNDVNRDEKEKWVGNGQYMLFRRETYRRIGGHEAVRNRVDEDYKLAERVKKAGFRLRVLSAPNALQTRMYSNLRDLWEGWVKNSFAVMGDKLTRAVSGIFSVFIFLLLPYLLLFAGIFSFPSEGLNPLLLWGGLMSLIVYGRIGGVYVGVKADLKYLPLFPMSVTLYLIILLESAARGLLGMEVAWKGRRYQTRNL
ncbi:MAG: glycosyltransferase [Thermoplasmata archaeon]